MDKNKKLINKIFELKKKKNAIILAHNYQNPEIQDIADYMGDSFGLSRKAANTDADIIVFCGVTFMAETAKILSPDKKVIIPDKTAGCPLADMITVSDLKNLKKDYPSAITIAYVNSAADIKAEIDICCTSGNAVDIVNSLPKDKDIIFIPDKYLGDYVSRVTERKLILWNGFCPTHAKILAEHVIKIKNDYPCAEILVHPECRRDVIALSDYAFSTAGMCDHIKNSDTTEFIIGTDIGLVYRLQSDNPDKKIYHIYSQAVCPNMKKINLEKVLWAFEQESYEINLEKEIIEKASIGLNRMLDITACVNK